MTTKPLRRILTFGLGNCGRTITVTVRVARARRWFDSRTSRSPHWLVLPIMPGGILAVMVRLD
jgi:hypothetical protein